MISSGIAANAYLDARPAIAPTTGSGPGKVAADFASVMENVDRAATGAMSGHSDTHLLVQSIAQAEIALETAVAIRDKVVEAYQEILRMPV